MFPGQETRNRNLVLPKVCHPLSSPVSGLPAPGGLPDMEQVSNNVSHPSFPPSLTPAGTGTENSQVDAPRFLIRPLVMGDGQPLPVS